MDQRLVIPLIKTTYTNSVKKAINIYRNKNLEKYNENQRNYYQTAKTNEEWKQKFNERCKVNNKIYRDKKSLENPPKPKGRPKRPMPIINVTEIPLAVI